MTCPVSAIITAYRRIDQTLVTLDKIQRCRPAPAEILVHVDANEQRSAEAVRTPFPDVRVLLSEENTGPGGGRGINSSK